MSRLTSGVTRHVCTTSYHSGFRVVAYVANDACRKTGACVTTWFYVAGYYVVSTPKTCSIAHMSQDAVSCHIARILISRRRAVVTGFNSLTWNPPAILQFRIQVQLSWHSRCCECDKQCRAPPGTSAPVEVGRRRPRSGSPKVQYPDRGTTAVGDKRGHRDRGS